MPWPDTSPEPSPEPIKLSDALAAFRKTMGIPPEPTAEGDNMPYGELHKQGYHAPCHWCGKTCGGTCLGLTDSVQMKPQDPAYWMLKDGKTSTTDIHDDSCYICRDPEFAAMGLPLCRSCPDCSQEAGKPAGHVPADDIACTVCGKATEYEAAMAQQEQQAKETG